MARKNRRNVKPEKISFGRMCKIVGINTRQRIIMTRYMKEVSNQSKSQDNG